MLGALVAGFLFTSVPPHEVMALGAAAIPLMSRRMASRDLIGLVDWHLLVLFNLLIVGSIANIIVVEQAGALGIRIGWTLATLALAAAWLWLRAR